MEKYNISYTVFYILLLAVAGCTSHPEKICCPNEVLSHLNWGRIYVGQSEKDLLSLATPDSVKRYESYASFLFLESDHYHLEILTYERQVVSAMSMSDTGPIMIYFDSNPETLEKRLLLAKLRYWELKSKWDEVSGVEPYEELDGE